MKISYNWLKEYLPIDYLPEKVAEVLTDIGLEVEGIEKVEAVKGGMEGLVVGHVLTAAKHPDADKLTLTTVDIGGDQVLSIVCGAPNVAAGQKVLVATVGTTLYPHGGDPFTIKKAKIRGQESCGMICAEDEIGIGTDHSGIIVLPAETSIGLPAKELYKLEDDYIFEIGLTPNRSDAHCHVGVARDLYAALKINHQYMGDFYMPSIDHYAKDNDQLPIAVKVEDNAACIRYVGVSISNVQVKESPDWLKKRLLAIGIRSINNIVDITNFVLHELGQPLHAFDADKITNRQVIVKTLPDQTPFVTLDGITRTLNAEDLIICDGQSNPMCLAGVFGGQSSGVSEQTTHVFLESACFDAIRTRRTSQRHGLRTEAATRFEKGVDPNLQRYALQRAALLIKELANGQIASDIVDLYPQPVVPAQVTVTYRNIQRIIGVAMSRQQVTDILTALNMPIIAENEQGITVTIPTDKTDVTREADVIEEILRIYGLNTVPIPTAMHTNLAYSQTPDSQGIWHSVADFLAANGFYEIMCTSINNANYYENQPDIVRLIKSMNVNMDVLRKTMLYGGLKAIELNQNNKTADLQLFEFGKTYHTHNSPKTDSPEYREEEHLALWITGFNTNEHWRQGRQKSNYFDLKQNVENILTKLGLDSKSVVSYIEEDNLLSYGLQWKTASNPQKILVQLGAVKASVLRQHNLKNEVYYADFYWENIIREMKNIRIEFAEIVRYPIVRRDLALVLDSHVRYEQIEAIAVKSAKNMLKSVVLFDVFEDENKLGAGKKSYALGFWLQAADRTLTDAEIDKTMQQILQAVIRQTQAELR